MVEHRRWLTGVAVAILALTASDTDTAKAPPTTRPSSTAPTKSSDPERIAPAVEQPLDIETFTDRPCTSLTTAQLKSLKLGPGTPIWIRRPISSCT